MSNTFYFLASAQEAIEMKQNEVYGVVTDDIKTTPNEVYGVRQTNQ